MQIGKDQHCLGEPDSAGRSKTILMRRQGRILVCFVMMASLAGTGGPGQQRPTGAAQGWPPLNSPSNQPPDANQQMLMHQQQAKKQSLELVNAERKKIIADESALLLKLATDLKTEVDKTDKDTLSLSVIRKAEAIEKLASTMSRRR